MKQAEQLPYEIRFTSEERRWAFSNWWAFHGCKIFNEYLATNLKHKKMRPYQMIHDSSGTYCYESDYDFQDYLVQQTEAE